MAPKEARPICHAELSRILLELKKVAGTQKAKAPRK
jgi:hypothetical protein